MSKVKGEIFDLNKSKLRHNLRRVETQHKKNSRIKKSNNNAYRRLGKGYWVEDSKYVWTYKTIDVPEETKNITKPIKKVEIIWNEDHTDFIRKERLVWVVVDKKTIPAHTKRVRDDYTIEKTTPRVIRCDRKGGYKRFIKKYANKVCRKTLVNEPLNRGVYKKTYDVAWELW